MKHKVRLLRERQGIATTAALHRATGVPIRTLRRAELEGRLGWGTALKLAPALGVQPQDLMPKEGP